VLPEILRKYDSIISEFTISDYEINGSNIKLRALIILIDGSQLKVRQVIIGDVFKYSYHWQSSNAILIKRWDNAPHWKNLSTCPHHVHVSIDRNVTDSVCAGDLELVMKEIQQNLNSSSSF